MSAAEIQDAAEPASMPVIVTGRSHHVAHRIIGSVPVELLHESPYPVLTISLPEHDPSGAVTCVGGGALHIPCLKKIEILALTY